MLFVVLFLIFVLVLSCAYTFIYKEELYEKLRDLKMSLGTLKKSLYFI